MEKIISDAHKLKSSWDSDLRWKGIRRDFTAEEVIRLRGSFKIEHSVASQGAKRLWELLNTEDYVSALAASRFNLSNKFILKSDVTP